MYTQKHLGISLQSFKKNQRQSLADFQKLGMEFYPPNLGHFINSITVSLIFLVLALSPSYIVKDEKASKITNFSNAED